MPCPDFPRHPYWVAFWVDLLGPRVLCILRNCTSQPVSMKTSLLQEPVSGLHKFTVIKSILSTLGMRVEGTVGPRIIANIMFLCS